MQISSSLGSRCLFLGCHPAGICGCLCCCLSSPPLPKLRQTSSCRRTGDRTIVVSWLSSRRDLRLSLSLPVLSTITKTKADELVTKNRYCFLVVIHRDLRLSLSLPVLSTITKTKADELVTKNRHCFLVVIPQGSAVVLVIACLSTIPETAPARIWSGIPRGHDTGRNPKGTSRDSLPEILVNHLYTGEGAHLGHPYRYLQPAREHQRG